MRKSMRGVAKRTQYELISMLLENMQFLFRINGQSAINFRSSFAGGLCHGLSLLYLSAKMQGKETEFFSVLNQIMLGFPGEEEEKGGEASLCALQANIHFTVDEHENINWKVSLKQEDSPAVTAFVGLFPKLLALHSPAKITPKLAQKTFLWAGCIRKPSFCVSLPK